MTLPKLMPLFVAGGVLLVSSVALAAAPPNDNFENALVLTGRSGDIAHHSENYNPPTLQAGEPELIDPEVASRGAGKGSLWYNYAVPASGFIYLALDQPPADAMLAVYTGPDLEHLHLVAVSSSPQAGGGVYLYRQFEAGTVLRIRVDGRGTNYYGQFRLWWEWLGGSSIATTQWLYVWTETYATVLTYDFGTGHTTIRDLLSGYIRVNYARKSSWVGNYIYDYYTGRFTESMYDLTAELPLQQTSGTAEARQTAQQAFITEPADDASSNSAHFSENSVLLVNTGSLAPATTPSNTLPYQALFFNYTTQKVSASDIFQGGGAETFYSQKPNEWVGIFLYDYLAGQYIDASYRLKLPPQ